MYTGTAALIPLLLAVVLWPTGCARQNRGLERVTQRDLPQPEEIQQVPCEGSAAFFENGTLMSCSLSRAADVDLARLPERTRVRFREDGKLWYAFLPGDTELQGHVCKGGGHGYMTGFHPSGRLRLCWLATDEEIDGIPCVKATVRGEMLGRLAGRGGPEAVFYDSGRLRSCKLSRKIELQGRVFKKGRRIALDEDGKPAEP